MWLQLTKNFAQLLLVAARIGAQMAHMLRPLPSLDHHVGTALLEHVNHCLDFVDRNEGVVG